VNSRSAGTRWPATFGESTHRFIVHDRDSIYAEGVDLVLRAMRLRVLKTPVAAPQANAHCERLIGTARRECLDWVIPLNERHLRRILAEWVPHYNQARTRASVQVFPIRDGRVRWSGAPATRFVPIVTSPPRQVLGGLHHEYLLDPGAV
jgi:transposase InsO family protein